MRPLKLFLVLALIVLGGCIKQKPPAYSSLPMIMPATLADGCNGVVMPTREYVQLMLWHDGVRGFSNREIPVSCVDSREFSTAVCGIDPNRQLKGRHWESVWLPGWEAERLGAPINVVVNVSHLPPVDRMAVVNAAIIKELVLEVMIVDLQAALCQ